MRYLIITILLYGCGSTIPQAEQSPVTQTQVKNAVYRLKFETVGNSWYPTSSDVDVEYKFTNGDRVEYLYHYNPDAGSYSFEFQRPETDSVTVKITSPSPRTNGSGAARGAKEVYGYADGATIFSKWTWTGASQEFTFKLIP